MENNISRPVIIRIQAEIEHSKAGHKIQKDVIQRNNPCSEIYRTSNCMLYQNASAVFRLNSVEPKQNYFLSNTTVVVKTHQTNKPQISKVALAKCYLDSTLVRKMEQGTG